ncbi:MFS transporter [Patescibacteria group bacterium]
MKLRKEHYIILIIQITETLGFSLILPFLPFFAEDLGASPLVVGLILTSFSLLQFVFAPIMGRLSDHYGRRPLLIFSQISTFLSFIILGLAKSIPIIFLSRVVDGLLGSNFTIAQAYLSDISSKKERSQAFGLSGIAFGIGFLIGPAIGGFLSRFGYHLPSFIAAGISLFSIIITYIFLPETVKRTKASKKVKIIDLKVFKKFFFLPKINLKLLQLFTYLLAHIVWTSTFALYARKQFAIKPEQVGYLLGYVGLLIIVLRGGLLGKLIKIFGENKLKTIGMVLITLGLAGAIFTPNYKSLFVVMTFFAIGSGLSRPLLIGAISREVSDKDQGAILGVTNSLGSLAQIFGPLIGGIILDRFFSGYLGLISALIMSFGLLLSLIEIKRTRSKK